MKRHLLIAAIFLLAGAVVNVAVAWGCAVQPWTDGNYRWTDGFQKLGTSPPRPVGYRYWKLTCLDRIGGTRIVSQAWAGFIHGPVGQQPPLSLVPSWCRITPRVLFPQDHNVIEDAYGWPMLSMSSGWQRADYIQDWRVLHAVELQTPQCRNGSMRALAVPLAPMPALLVGFGLLLAAARKGLAQAAV